MSRLLYLHGFRSSPSSFKARLMAARLEQLGQIHRFLCPQLPVSPREAMALVLERFAPGPEDTLIGSSLGGCYATWLAERIGCRAVLLNPSVRPGDRFAQYVGPQTTWHSGEPFEFRPEYVEEARALHVAQTTRPERYFLVAAKGDELLDWRDMVAHYAGARHNVLEGSDHGLSDFADYLDEVLEFAGVGVK